MTFYPGKYCPQLNNSCGFRPEFVVEPSVDHRFRPVEWRWAIKHLSQPAPFSDDLLAAELSQDADI
jgi:hypothetical protein